jgi:hypothetical protein
MGLIEGQLGGISKWWLRLAWVLLLPQIANPCKPVLRACFAGLSRLTSNHSS